MKLAFALKIVAHAVESSSELSLSVCEGQCPDPLATCTETGDSEFGFVCNCPMGYSWMESSGHCEDVDECIEGFNGFMGNELCNADGGTAYICVNLIGAFTCGCNSGYNFFLDTHECVDIDKCADGTSGCEFGSQIFKVHSNVIILVKEDAMIRWLHAKYHMKMVSVINVFATMASCGTMAPRLVASC